MITLLVAISILQGNPRVVDGDTLVVEGQRVRLAAIDAPEGRQTCFTDQEWRCGDAATSALRNMIGTDPVRCEVSGLDRYRRSVATCWSGSINLNSEMVRQGWAMAYRQFGTQFVPEEDEARRNRAGIWGSTFTPPWEWRRQRRNSN